MVYVEVILQTLLAFAAILIYTRILGKQQVGQLTFLSTLTGLPSEVLLLLWLLILARSVLVFIF